MSATERVYSDIKEVHQCDRETQKFTLTDEGKVALRTLTEVSFAAVDEPDILIADAVAANTEVAFTLPNGVKKIRLKTRTLTRLRIAWTATETANDGDYLSIGIGGVYTVEGIKTKDNRKIFLRTNKSNVKIEIEVWK